MAGVAADAANPLSTPVHTPRKFDFDDAVIGSNRQSISSLHQTKKANISAASSSSSAEKGDSKRKQSRSSSRRRSSSEEIRTTGKAKDIKNVMTASSSSSKHSVGQFPQRQGSRSNLAPSDEIQYESRQRSHSAVEKKSSRSRSRSGKSVAMSQRGNDDEIEVVPSKSSVQFTAPSASGSASPGASAIMSRRRKHRHQQHGRSKDEELPPASSDPRSHTQVAGFDPLDGLVSKKQQEQLDARTLAALQQLALKVQKSKDSTKKISEAVAEMSAETVKQNIEADEKKRAAQMHARDMARDKWRIFAIILACNIAAFMVLAYPILFNRVETTLIFITTIVAIPVFLKSIFAFCEIHRTGVVAKGNERVIAFIPAYKENRRALLRTIESFPDLYYNLDKIELVICVDGKYSDRKITPQSQSPSSPSTPGDFNKLLRSVKIITIETPNEPSLEQDEAQEELDEKTASQKLVHTDEILLDVLYGGLEYAPAPDIVPRPDNGELMEQYQGIYKGVKFTLFVKIKNGGKRDSQLFLFHWLRQRAAADRPPYTLFVDSDTQLERYSISRLIFKIGSDPNVAACCGETRVSNPVNWLSKMQVFDYWSNHALGKAFENRFGLVTCLPGCFSIYRTELLLTDYLINRYSHKPHTLMEKNLLDLGEDRYMTTVLMKYFMKNRPNMRLEYVCEAKCSTVVPHSFEMFKKQRRRWTNSTLVNQWILIRVAKLWKRSPIIMIYVFLDFVGTLIMPAGILTFFLLIFSSFSVGSIGMLTLVFIFFFIACQILIAYFLGEEARIVYIPHFYSLLPFTSIYMPFFSLAHFDDFNWGTR